MYPNPNDCSKNKDECVELLSRVVSLLERTPREERTNIDYLERNVLNYSWLLQSLNPVVDIAAVEALVGNSINAATQRAIRELIFGGFATYAGVKRSHGPRTYLLCPLLYEAISEQLQSSAMYGDMLKPRELLGNISGLELLAYLIEDNNTSLISIIANALYVSMGKLVTVRRLEDVPELSDSYALLESELAAFTRIVSFPQNWSFNLFVYPSSRALDTITVNSIKTFLHDIRITLYEKDQRQYNAIQSLFITPAIDLDIDVRSFSRYIHINYMWAFSALRFVTVLQTLKAEFKGQEQLLAQNFYSIFNQQNSIAFSVQEAVKILNRKLTEKKSPRSSSS